MNILTLNAHSWCEPDQPAKIMEVARLLVRERIDVVAIQEANQLHAGIPGAHPVVQVHGDVAAGADNYADLLARACRHLGVDYQAHWVEAHLGFGIYDEGVAVLVRAQGPEAPRVQDVVPVLVGDYPFADVRRRVVLAVRIEVQGQSLWVASGHFSWWEMDGQPQFAQEWEAFSRWARSCGQELVILAGDLNAPADASGQGADLWRSHGWVDTRDACARPEGCQTIVGGIAGWEDAREAMRIDYVLSNRPVDVDAHRVVFGHDSDTPVVSDHAGVLVAMNMQSSGKETFVDE